MAFNSKRVVYADGSLVRLFSLQSGTALGTLKGHIGIVMCMDFGSVGTGTQSLLLTAGTDRAVHVYDWDSLSYLASTSRKQRHARRVTALKLAPSHALTASVDSTIRSWDLGTMALKDIRCGEGGFPVFALAVVDDSVFFTGGLQGTWRGTVRVWDVRVSTRQGAVRTLTIPSAVCALHWNAQSQTVAIGERTGAVGVWDFRKAQGPDALVHKRGPNFAVYSLYHDQSRLMTCQAQAVNIYHTFHVATHDHRLRPIPKPQLRGVPTAHNIFHCLHYDPNLDMLAVAATDYVSVWTPTQTHSAFDRKFHEVAHSPDNNGVVEGKERKGGEGRHARGWKGIGRSRKPGRKLRSGRR